MGAILQKGPLQNTALCLLNIIDLKKEKATERYDFNGKYKYKY